MSVVCRVFLIALFFACSVAKAADIILSASELDYPPFATVSKDGRADGFSVELLRAALNALGRDVEFKVGSWHQIKQDLTDGRIQVLPLVAITPERRKTFEFTTPYFSLHGAIIVRKGDQRIKQVSDLMGKTVVVMKSDSAEEYVQLNRLADTIKTTETLEEGLKQLAGGMHDAMIVQRLAGETIIQNLGLTNLEVAGPPLERFIDFAFAVKLGDRELLALLNEGLALTMANGTYERLRQKWIVPTRDEQLAEMRKTIAIVLATLLLAGIAGYAVQRTLRRLIATRTAELAQRTQELTASEAVLRESEARYHSLFQNSHAVMLLINPEDGSIVASNPAASAFYGWTRDELCTMKISEINTLSPAEINAEMQRAKTQQRTSFEFRHRCADQRIRDVEVFTGPVEIAGKPMLFSIVHDITDRKRAEEDLNRYRDHLEEEVQKRSTDLIRAEFLSDQAMELSQAGYWSIDFAQSDEYYTSSHRAVAIFGDLPKDSLRYHLKDEWLANIEAADKDAAAATRSDYRAAIEGRGSRYETTYPYKRPIDGKIIWVHALGHVVRDEQGRPRHMYGVAIDITAKKITDDALRRAKHAAEEASMAKSDFLANMSHEIRTPMNAILGMANLLRREGVTPQQADRLDKIDVASHHLLGLINDILDLSKIEAGKLTIDSMPFSLAKIIDHVRELAHPLVQSKGLSLTISAPKLPDNLLGDPLRLQQSLLNFVSNAIKFTESGGVTLTVDVLAEDSDQISVKCTVSDTGIGISSDKIDRLFTNFEQGDSSTTREFGGTGLGLAITRRLIELMGGQVGVISNPGSGSHFWLSVSLKKALAPVVMGTASRAEPAEAILIREWRGTRILLAEDEPVNQEITSMLLLDCGLSVDVADDGAEAWDKMQSGEYALVILDMQMPRMGGVEVAKQIRSAPMKQMPIVALTANALVEDRDACLAAGMNDFLTKPFNPEVLFDMVLKWLSMGSWQEAAQGKARFVLDPTLHLGMQTLDKEHEALFARLNYLIDLPKDTVGVAQFHQSLGDLGQFIMDHFSTEEQYFGASSLPLAEQERHRSAHQKIIRQFSEMQIYLMSSMDPDYTKIAETIDGWLKGHFVSFDLKLKPFLANQASG